MKHPCSRLIAAACAGFVSITCFGQSAPVFTTETSASGPTPFHVYAVDVNNDGLTDIIQDTANPGPTGSFFTVSINNGNGTFKAPVTYNINYNNTNPNTWTPLTWGDFNNDGKVDIAVAIPNTSQLNIYLGNGDGTFQAPVTTTVGLPSGMRFGAGFPDNSIVAADFNHDGKLDLVTAVYDGDGFGGTWAVYLLLGDGTGHFTNPTDIYNPTSGWTVQKIVSGDFDTDGNADVALLEQMTCSSGIDFCWSNVVTLFGGGDTTFDPVDVFTLDGTMDLGAADLNNDGATDLYGIQYKNISFPPPDFGINPGGTRLAVFLGHYDRRFSYLYTPAPSYQTLGIQTPFAVADFNGTGQWALAALAATYGASGNPSYQMIYFLNAGSPNVSIAYGPSPAGSGGFQFGPAVGNFNGDTKPDIAVNASATINSPTSTLAVGVNDTPQGFWGGCNYPSSGQGIHLCSPTAQTTHGPITFEASANSLGQLRKIELWLDGVKIGEDHLVWGQSGYFDLTYTPSAGTHNATIYAADIDDSLQRYDFTFTTN